MRHKFSVLLEELRAAETSEYRTVIVAFINCLIAGCDDLDSRSTIRDELLGDLLLHRRSLIHLHCFCFVLHTLCFYKPAYCWLI